MIHARFAVAAIASVTIAVGLPELIKQWCTSAHALTQTAPPESTLAVSSFAVRRTPTALRTSPHRRDLPVRNCSSEGPLARLASQCSSV